MEIDEFLTDQSWQRTLHKIREYEEYEQNDNLTQSVCEKGIKKKIYYLAKYVAFEGYIKSGIFNDKV